MGVWKSPSTTVGPPTATWPVLSHVGLLDASDTLIRSASVTIEDDDNAAVTTGAEDGATVTLEEGAMTIDVPDGADNDAADILDGIKDGLKLALMSSATVLFPVSNGYAHSVIAKADWVYSATE